MWGISRAPAQKGVTGGGEDLPSGWPTKPKHRAGKPFSWRLRKHVSLVMDGVPWLVPEEYRFL